VNLDPYLWPYTKSTQNRLKNEMYETETENTKRKHGGNTSRCQNGQRFFLDTILKGEETKAKIDKWDYIKKSFYIAWNQTT
jgi:hypothetical protein